MDPWPQSLREALAEWTIARWQNEAAMVAALDALIAEWSAYWGLLPTENGDAP